MSPTPGPVRFLVRLTPRGGRDAVDGVDGEGRLRARVAAAPVEGEANRSLCRLLAAELGQPLSAVALEAGQAGRIKRVAVTGLGPETVMARWPGVAILDASRRAIGSVG